MKDVPYFDLLRLLHDQEGQTTEARFRWATAQIESGASHLGEAFANSVKQLASYTGDGRFRPKSAPRPRRDVTRKTARFAWCVDQAGGIEVPGRPELGGRFVDFELSTMSTPGGASWLPSDDPTFPQPAKAANAPVKVDVLLENAGRPVVGEVKLDGDKDPVAALLQGLVYAVTLSTAEQRARLRLHESTELQFSTTDHLVDVALVIGRSKRPSATRVNAASTPAKAHLWLLMPQLVAAVAEHPGVSAHVGRIYGLGVDIDADGWVVGRDPESPPAGGRVLATALDWMEDAADGAVEPFGVSE